MKGQNHVLRARLARGRGSAVSVFIMRFALQPANWGLQHQARNSSSGEIWTLLASGRCGLFGEGCNGGRLQNPQHGSLRFAPDKMGWTVRFALTGRA